MIRTGTCSVSRLRLSKLLQLIVGLDSLGCMEYLAKLKALIALRRLTQKELAQRVGIHENKLSRIMKGEQKPDLELAFLLADALEVSLDFLTRDVVDLESPGRLIQVRDEDFVILEVTRTIGYEAAMARLTVASRPAQPEAKGPELLA